MTLICLFSIVSFSYLDDLPCHVMAEIIHQLRRWDMCVECVCVCGVCVCVWSVCVCVCVCGVCVCVECVCVCACVHVWTVQYDVISQH